MDTPLDINGELAVAGDLHGRMGDHAARFLGLPGRGVDVVDQHVRPDHRLLG